MTDPTYHPPEAGAQQSGGQRWGLEFPYHWDADEVVSRRELLGFAVYASGALFAATALLAGLSQIPRSTSGPVQAIARVGDVPEGMAVYFHYPDQDPTNEAMLLHLPGGNFVAYSQTCTHLSCSVFYQSNRQRLYCPCHEGVFNPSTGDPVAGPPQRRLPRIQLRQEGEVLYAVGRFP